MNTIKILPIETIEYVPHKATPGSAAYDLFVQKDIIVTPGRQVIPLGIKIEIPCNFEFKIEPRSGHSSKGMLGRSFYIDGSGKTHIDYESARFDADVIVGKIDSDYRGEIMVIVNSREKFIIKKGTAIAQGTLYRVEESEIVFVDKLSDTGRSSGGFGHSDNKTLLS